ncbi:MAG: hypothetical protein ACKPHU_07300, partial [Planctomycetaceae bacterium]
AFYGGKSALLRCAHGTCRLNYGQSCPGFMQCPPEPPCERLKGTVGAADRQILFWPLMSMVGD